MLGGLVRWFIAALRDAGGWGGASPDCVRYGGLHPGLFSSAPYGRDTCGAAYRSRERTLILRPAGAETRLVLVAVFDMTEGLS